MEIINYAAGEVYEEQTPSLVTESPNAKAEVSILKQKVVRGLAMMAFPLVIMAGAGYLLKDSSIQPVQTETVYAQGETSDVPSLFFGPEYEVIKTPNTTKVFVQTAATPEGNVLVSFVEGDKLYFRYIRGTSLQPEAIEPPIQPFTYPARPHLLYENNSFISYFHAYREGEMPRIWYLSILEQSGAPGDFQTIPVMPSRPVFRQMYPSIASTSEERFFVWQEDREGNSGQFSLWTQRFSNREELIGENKELDFKGLSLQHPKAAYNPDTRSYTVSGLLAYLDGGRPKVDLCTREFTRESDPVGDVVVVGENLDMATDYTIFYGGKIGGIWTAYLANGSLWVNSLKPGFIPRQVVSPDSNWFVNGVDTLVTRLAEKTYFIFLYRQQSLIDPNEKNYLVTVFDPENQQVGNSVPLPSSNPRQRFASLTKGFVFWEGLSPEESGNSIFGARIKDTPNSFRQFLPLIMGRH